MKLFGMNYKKFFKEYQWEIYTGLSIFIILVLAIYNYRDENKKGKWSENFVYHNDQSMPKIKPDMSEVGKESKLEIMVKNILQDLTRRNWDKIRPDFLKNQVTGQNLEFDCWNEEFGIAVEIQGQQHYKYTPFFHKNYEAFRNQQYRDELKRMMAKNNDIKLIEVPYNIPPKKMRDFVRKELQRCGVYC